MTALYRNIQLQNRILLGQVPFNEKHLGKGKFHKLGLNKKHM